MRPASESFTIICDHDDLRFNPFVYLSSFNMQKKWKEYAAATVRNFLKLSHAIESELPSLRRDAWPLIQRLVHNLHITATQAIERRGTFT